MGVLITGDDGHVYIACANNRAYAVQVDIKDGRKEDVVSRIQTVRSFVHGYPIDSHWPEGIAFRSGRFSLTMVTPGYGRTSSLPTLEPIQYMFSMSKENESHALVRTNVGLERFDDFIEDLDSKAWETTSISLENISPTSKIQEKWGFCGSDIEFKAREVKLRNRENTDVARIG